MSVFRPWGHIDWLLNHLSPTPWALLACCGTEARSIALANHLGRHRLRSVEIVCIHDPDPLDQAANNERLLRHRQILQDQGYQAAEIQDVNLLAGLDTTLGPVNRLTTNNSTRVIIDITSLPKLWFFPIIQAVLEDNRFEDVIVTYTSAGDYSDRLSENNELPRVLPGFFAEDGRSQHESIIIGIGFEPSNLVEWLSGQDSDNIRLIFPFPPGPPSHRRNWMFVKQLEERTQGGQIDPPNRVHINMYDCPQVFEALCDMTSDGHQTAALAPYGPKTMSLAMCLFSLAAAAAGRPRVPVYYAQPHRYTLDYTRGTGMHDNVPEITGYCLRLAGRDLYTLP